MQIRVNLYVASGPLGPAKRRQLIALSAESRLPAIYSFRVFPVDGGLMSFGADYRDRVVITDIDIADRSPAGEDVVLNYLVRCSDPEDGDVRLGSVSPDDVGNGHRPPGLHGHADGVRASGNTMVGGGRRVMTFRHQAATAPTSRHFAPQARPSGDQGISTAEACQPARRVDLVSIELWRTRSYTSALSQVIDRMFEQTFLPVHGGHFCRWRKHRLPVPPGQRLGN